jgi:tRNA threonylcarbamoyladenosine biosynthesis protein TsaB
MIVLGFDTATQATAVGLRLADGATLRAHDDPGPGEHPGHATRLLTMAAQVLGEAGIGWSALDRIAVGVGPGRFTGLRVGIATARGLAQSLSLELVGVSSPLALALAASGRGGHEDEEEVLAVIDARRGEVFAAAYASASATGPATEEGERCLPRELVAPRALAPADLGEVVRDARASGAAGTGWLAVGDGAVLYRTELESLGAAYVPPEDSPLHMVSGAAICEIAAGSTGEAIDTVLPDYQRRPDAQIALEHAGAPADVAPASGASASGRAIAAGELDGARA